jgi:hypothetical protein
MTDSKGFWRSKASHGPFEGKHGAMERNGMDDVHWILNIDIESLFVGCRLSAEPHYYLVMQRL